MAATLYVAIRGNYTEFQRDMTRVRGIAKESCRELANQFNNAIDPKFFKKGLSELARGLKDISRIATTRGGFLAPAIADLKDLAAKAEVSSQTMQMLANRMTEVGRREQLSGALKKIQKYAGLTDAELAKLQKKMGDTAGSMETAMNALGVRSTQQIKRDIAALEAAFDHLAKHGKLSAEELERAFAGLEKKLEPLYAELGVLNKPAGRSASLDVLGMKTDAEYRAEAKKIAQAYLEIKTSANSTAGDVLRAHARMVESFRRLREEMTAGQAKPQKPLWETDPEKVLGIRSSKEIFADIAAIQQAFMTFSLAAGRTAEEVERAKAKMQASIRDLYREAGVLRAADKRDGFLQLLGIRSIEQIEADKQALIRAHKELVAEFNSGLGGVTERDLRNSLAARNAGLQRLAQEAGTWQAGARAQVDPLRQKYDKLASQVGGAGVSFGQYEAKSKASEAVKAFQELHGRLPKYAKEFHDLAQAAGVSAREIWKVRDAMDHTSNAFKALIGYGQVWLTFGFVHTAQDFVKTAMSLENVEVAFKAIYGTTDMAQKKLEYVRQVSDELGLSFMDTAEGAKKLFAAAQGTPIEAEANMVFRAFSNMSAAMKLTGDETKGVFLAISQMISKGKVSAEELRQQLAERMPGAVNLFAKSIGVSTQELDKMLQAGGVTLEHFLMFAREVNAHYATGARQASHTLQAEMARIGNTWAKFQQDMTDTGALAGIARDFNSVFSGVTGTIVKFREEIKLLMKAAFAGWIASSLVPGGKLNSLIMALGVSFKTTARQMKLFEAFSLSMSAGVNRAALAVGKLRIALNALMRHPLVAAIVTTGIAFGLEKLFEPKEDDRFKGEIVPSGESIQEKLRKRMQAEAANKDSSFSPETIRKSLLDDINKEMNALEQGTVAAGERFKDAIFAAYKEGQGMFSDVPEDQYIKMGEARAKAFEQFRSFQQEMKNLVDAKDADGLLKLQDKILFSWEKIGKSLEESGFKKEAVDSMHDLFNRLSEVAGLGFDDISKLLATYSGDAVNAAKDLGLEMDKATKKMFDGLEKAAQSSAIGKAAKQLQNFEKIAKQMGDVGKDLKFDTVIAACGQYSDSIVGVTNKLDNAYQKHAEYEQKLKSVRVREEQGYASKLELAKAQTQVTAQTQVLNEWQDKLAMSIFNAASAAGGSPAAFDAMISVFEQAAKAAGWTAEQIAQIVGELQRVQAQAIETMNAAASAAAISGAESALLGTEAQAAYQKGDFDSWYAINQYKDTTSGKGVASREARKRQWDLMKENDRRRKQLQDAAKAGRKGKGGGGGKRVDNTQEKYHSAEEGWRKKIADMQGQKDVQTLAKDFADMDKQLKGSSVDMKALKKEYFEAFNTHSLHEFEKTMFQLVGNEKALADIDIEEKLKAQQAQFDGMNKAAQELGLSTVDYTAKMEAYRKALQNNSNEQWLEKQIPVYQEIAIYEKDKTKVLELQNQLIDIQAEKMANTFPPEVVERWKEVQRLQNATDAFSGIKRGFNSIAKDSMNAAQFMENTMTQTYDILSEGFTNFVTKGKVDMQDLLNSWINMVNQMVMKAAMSKVFDLIGGLFSSGAGMFAGAAGGVGVASAERAAEWASRSASAVSSAAGKVAAGAAMVASARGNVFTGLHGWSNQIVDRPTLFSYGSQITKFAKGGVMGEAGPEAIMPLTRTASGHLGVRTDGAAAPQSMAVTLVISDQTEGGVKADATGGELDGKQIAVIVKQVENAMVARSLNGKSQYTKYLDRTRGLSNAKQLY